MPTQSPGDGGGGGGGGGGFGGAGAAATGGGLERSTRQIKPPGGQERPIDSVPTASRSAPCPGCVDLEDDITPCLGADCDDGGRSDDDFLRFILRGGGFRGSPGSGEPRAGPGGIIKIISSPRPGDPPLGGGGDPPGGGEDPPGGGGAGSFTPGRPGSSQGFGGVGRDLNRLLGGLLELLRGAPPGGPPRTHVPVFERHGELRGVYGEELGFAFPAFPPTGVRSAGNAPLPPPAAATRARFILKRVPGSFELPEDEHFARRRRRAEYTAPVVQRSNRPR